MAKSLNAMTNEELALNYIAGNNDAFDLLLDRIKGDVFSYILFNIRDKDKADDVFQETFIRIIMWMQEGRYSNTGKFTAWAIRIAHNIMMDRYRDQRSHPMVSESQNDTLATAFVADSRESSMVNAQTLREAKQLMQKLPVTQREVVFMRCFQDLSFKEIAEATGVSINTALGRMRYGVINMRRMAKQQNMVWG